MVSPKQEVEPQSYEQQPQQQYIPSQKLVRCSNDQVLGGVCAGFAHYSNMDVGLMRLLFVLAFLLTGGTLLILYIVAWVILDEMPC